MVKKSYKTPQKVDLGGSWASFGRDLGRSWASSGRSWPPLGRFLDIQSRAFFKHGPNMGSKRPSGSIWSRFWRVLGGFWEDFRRVWRVFGSILEGCGKDFGNAWHDLALLGHILYVRTPAVSRVASRSVPMRGGPPPAWLDRSLIWTYNGRLGSQRGVRGDRQDK